MPPKARTMAILPMMSTISPSTAAALSAKTRCSGFAAAARRKMTMTMPAETRTSPPVTAGLTVARITIAPILPTIGGSTLQANMFSKVKTALLVAEIRLVRVPGWRSAKNRGAWPIRCRKRSRRRSAVTRGKVTLEITPARRDRMWSAARREISRPKANQAALLPPAPRESASTRDFSPYCVPTAQIAAAKPASRIPPCR